MFTKNLKTDALPSLAAFEDKKVTAGLKFILGGAYRKTEGGHMSEAAGGMDYVADAFNDARGVGIYGLCKNHPTSVEFWQSTEFLNWEREFGN